MENNQMDLGISESMKKSFNQGIGSLGTTREQQTQKMCETIQIELASLRQVADHKDGSPETEKALGDIQTLALLLDGGDSEMLNYLVTIRDAARQNPTD